MPSEFTEDEIAVAVVLRDRVTALKPAGVTVAR